MESSTSYAFDAFLECVEDARASDSIYWPIDNRFTTHTAPMWGDVYGLRRQYSFKKVCRLENLTADINEAFEQCGLDKCIAEPLKRINKNDKRREYVPSRRQIRKIIDIYARDLELYERSF